MTSATLRAISPACPGKRASRLAAAALLALAPLAAADSGLPFATLVAVCASCHGDDGRHSIVSGWGRIAGQNQRRHLSLLHDGLLGELERALTGHLERKPPFP